MNIHLLPPADIELDDAISYYNEQLPGLGDAFYQEFLKPTDIISYFPEAWRKVGSNTRRANIKKISLLGSLCCRGSRHIDYLYRPST
jgi:hypothetical protein